MAVEQHQINALEARIKKLEPEPEGCGSMLIQLFGVIALGVLFYLGVDEIKTFRAQIRDLQQQTQELREKK